MRQRSDSRVLAAVLFTDIVDSSAVATRIGDARWKGSIARHHAIVRRELKRFAICVPVINPVHPYVFSARTQNIEVSPQFGILLSRLWVR
jgi:hypothetical protein